MAKQFQVDVGTLLTTLKMMRRKKVTKIAMTMMVTRASYMYRFKSNCVYKILVNYALYLFFFADLLILVVTGAGLFL